ncbi:hypothetical protein RQP46_006528 [Phenoliferia psychrophenolica]
MRLFTFLSFGLTATALASRATERASSDALLSALPDTPPPPPFISSDPAYLSQLPVVFGRSFGIEAKNRETRSYPPPQERRDASFAPDEAPATTGPTYAPSPNSLLISLVICIPAILILVGIALYLERHFILATLRRPRDQNPPRPLGSWTDLPDLEYREDLVENSHPPMMLPPAYQSSWRPARVASAREVRVVRA